MFPHRNILNYTWASPDGKTHKETGHILIDRKWPSSMLEVPSFRGTDCDSDHYLVVAKVRGKLTVSKQTAKNLMWKDLIQKAE